MNTEERLSALTKCGTVDRVPVADEYCKQQFRYSLLTHGNHEWFAKSGNTEDEAIHNLYEHVKTTLWEIISK